MKIVTAAEMREIDRLTTEKYGVPSLTLMENAGGAVAEFAQKHFDFNSACVVCGKGNNGGDGFVAARKLHEAGKQVAVIILAKSADDLRGDAAEMFKKLPVAPLWVSEEQQFEKAEVQQAFKAELIVDAILGTGFKPPIKGIAADAVRVINATNSPVLAVDLPSGVDADCTEIPDKAAFVQAAGIISFTAPKPALVFAELTNGKIAIASISAASDVLLLKSGSRQEVITRFDIVPIPVVRPRNAHKGLFGHVLIVGGSVGKAGAAAMAGIAALRTGAGLVTVACPRSVQPTVASFAPEMMTEPLEETAEGSISSAALSRVLELMEGKSVLVVGPGLSRNSDTANFVRGLVRRCSLPLVLDADGVTAFAGETQELRRAGNEQFRVITPHPGEMSRLVGVPTTEVQKTRAPTALRVAELTNACVVLKGDRTVVTGGSAPVWINTTGNPGMAKGGSGDVLSGMIASMLAQRVNVNDSGVSGAAISGEMREVIAAKIQQANQQISVLTVAKAVHLHGLAGDLARTVRGERSMMAGDILNCIETAFEVLDAEATAAIASVESGQGSPYFTFIQR